MKMPNSYLFAINNEGRVFGLSTNGSKWKEFIYLGLEFKQLSAVPHFMWAVGGDRQIYVHVHGLDIPIRIKEESYENERWLPVEGFSSRLLPTDRFHYSSQDGSVDRSFDKIRVPSMAWQWEGPWHLETTLDGQPLDHDGWTYAVDFPATFHPKKQWKSCVRRRKWIRYRQYSAMNSWCAVAPLHKDPTQEPFIDISVGGQNIPGATTESLSVWAITAHGRVMFRTGVSTTSPEGLRWSVIAVPSGCEVNQISVGPTGLVWTVLWNGKALVRTGITRDCVTGESWVEVPPPVDELKLIHVAVGANAVWAITRDHKVWFRKGIRGETAGYCKDSSIGTGWVEMVGNMAMVSVGANDQVWAIGSQDRCLYFRTGVIPSELTGRKWRIIQAPMQLSRTSSNASLMSTGNRNSMIVTHREKRVRSWSSLARHSSSEVQGVLREWEETSHSAPTAMSLRLQKANGSSTKSVNENMRPQSCVNIEDESNSTSGSCGTINSVSTIQEHTEDSKTNIMKCSDVKTNPTAWSPIRSAGSVVGMEVHPESDGSAFDPENTEDAGVFGEDDTGEIFWEECDILWTVVAAGACNADPLCPPNWFIENYGAAELELSKPWRLKTLQMLKNRLPKDIKDYEKYEKAIDISSWIKTGEARSMLRSSGYHLEDCIIELEWVVGQNVDAGTFTILNSERTCTKLQLNLSEITCVVCCSEPSHPRIAIHTPKHTEDCSIVKLQFTGDTDMEDWMANLTLVCCQVNGVHGTPASDSIWTTTALGDIFVFDPTTFEINQNQDGSFVQQLDVIGLKTPFEKILHNCFPPGSSLEIHGCIPENADRFSINLHCPSISLRQKADADSKDIMLHFNPRFPQNVIIRNSFQNNAWGMEEREGPLVLKQGSEFSIRIICEMEEFKIFVNGELFTNYEHRLKPHNITEVQFTGDIVVSKLIYQSKMVIVPPIEMFWRQMGGHLKKVETCSAGVTWGIGFDNTAWVYTGGWGGSFLKGLETSNSGINPMNDVHSFYVYENQRWNPLTGYTSHGLPTDRYMWSDITGKHKRTREKTKLISMHWQWISEWSIDFHTPGGVDKEGWQYAMDFPAKYHGQKHFTDYVRRRRWVRKAKISTSGPWQELGNTKLVDVSLQVDGKSDVVHVWAVAVNGDAIYRRGVTASCPAGSVWEHVPSDMPLCNISCGTNYQVWAVGRNGSAYWRFGISTSTPVGAVWESVEPPGGKTLKQISVGKHAVWGLDSNGQLAVRREVTPLFPEGTSWQILPVSPFDSASQAERVCPGNITTTSSTNGFKHISAGNEVWAVTASGVISKRFGITQDNPAGIGWLHGIAGNFQHVSARGWSKEWKDHPG